MESFDFYSKTNNFKGKNVLITGATGGIGCYITETLVNLGANVIIVSRSEKKIIDKLKNLVKAKNFDKEICNLEIPTKINTLVFNVMKKFKGKLDCLIMCHAIFKVGRFMETNVDVFDQTLNLNTRSCFHLISTCTPFLKLTKGNVVVCSSLESLVPVAESFLNSVSKSMLNSLVQCSALELAPFGVRVNAVAPAITDTEIRVTEEFSRKENEKYLEEMGKANYFLLNKKVLDPNDVANAVLFLASDDASFMTGEILGVDNGYSLNHDLSFAPPEEEY